MNIHITPHLSIPVTELRFRTSRSGGPGGQNVNKLETRVELLFDVRNSPSLPEDQRAVLLRGLASRLDDAGVLRIVSQQSRSQWRNKELAVAKLVETLRITLKPKKKRFRTKPTGASTEKRLTEKKRRSEIKRVRRSVNDE